MKRTTALILALALIILCASPALAELRRGSVGEPVRQLQQRLLECGWLFEEPDGAYGRNTEAAVRNYQAYAGLPETGVADDATLQRLETDWILLTGGGENAEGDPPVNCVRIDEGVGVIREDCAEHQALHAQAEALLASGDADDAKQACALWESALANLYDRWLQAAAPADRLNVVAARATFLAFAENQRAALEALYKDDMQFVYRQMEALLHEQAARVCNLLWEIEGEGGEGQ